ncbi:hypothetical protein CLOP_g1145 [Closterium sp. NIES-67]|nr:hypothetical protein CLOP_g1145 [Closterium sp. NIES-67]
MRLLLTVAECCMHGTAYTSWRSGEVVAGSPCLERLWQLRRLRRRRQQQRRPHIKRLESCFLCLSPLLESSA